VIQRLTQALSMGATYEHACHFAGIAYSTFRTWITAAEAAITRLGENSKARPTKAEQPFLEFLEVVKRAEGQAVMTWLLKIEAAASEHWQAAAWKLERRYPEQYGRTVQDNRLSGELAVTPKVFRFPARVQTPDQWALTYGRGTSLPPHEEPA
jgi:hypothetical protein